MGLNCPNYLVSQSRYRLNYYCYSSHHCLLSFVTRGYNFKFQNDYVAGLDYRKRRATMMIIVIHYGLIAVTHTHINATTVAHLMIILCCTCKKLWNSCNVGI